ncbi:MULTISPECIES: CBS domain-containing protein [Shewanella]|uniref:CBS domain-containing protein n=1 Tax=Shewanella japonica TaxID=93973 RepID=A0ABN4YEU6_9GAMM|nr:MULTISPECIES: CBS domain-containing protein [Shewanella]ARD20830.1 CBS domain-containing protein [Shewanella japonica]KPZ73228.1 CBS domain protein [Shewanella sp. P1-14-1]MBQ4890787.1 CBS domain-containing protein [Shewanella sp. MMG014]OBT06748.1 CBS domain-containing protein [Shewanella sp. UCD-FRSSP16_17]
MKPTTPIKNRDVLMNQYAMIDGMLTISEAIAIAVEQNVSILVVNKRNEHDEYGMLLLSDIARKVLATNKSPERVNVYEIMIKPVMAVSADMDIRYTARLFDQFQINKAPVVENSNIIGFVTYDDIVLKGMVSQ